LDVATDDGGVQWIFNISILATVSFYWTLRQRKWLRYTFFLRTVVYASASAFQKCNAVKNATTFYISGLFKETSFHYCFNDYYIRHMHTYTYYMQHRFMSLRNLHFYGLHGMVRHCHQECCRYMTVTVFPHETREVN